MHRPRIKHSTTLLRGLFLFLLPYTLFSQASAPNGVSATLSYVAGARIFTAPSSADPAQRSRSTDIGSALSYALSYRRELFRALLLETSVEYTGATAAWRDKFDTEFSDGYDAYAVELRGLFELPFSGRVIRVCVGGGGGLYFGERNYSVADVQAESFDSSPAFGIHVQLGMEWHLWPQLSVRGDVRFRDPQISVANRFLQSSVMSNGVEYPLPMTPFPAGINLNGNMYGVGLLYYF